MTRSASTAGEVVSATTRRRTRQLMAEAWAVSALAARRAGAPGPPPPSMPAPVHRSLLWGTVWVGTLAGFVRVHPERMAMVSVVPPRWREQRRFFS